MTSPLPRPALLLVLLVLAAGCRATDAGATARRALPFRVAVASSLKPDRAPSVRDPVAHAARGEQITTMQLDFDVDAFHAALMAGLRDEGFTEAFLVEGPDLASQASVARAQGADLLLSCTVGTSPAIHHERVVSEVGFFFWWFMTGPFSYAIDEFRYVGDAAVSAELIDLSLVSGQERVEGLDDKETVIARPDADHAGLECDLIDRRGPPWRDTDTLGAYLTTLFAVTYLVGHESVELEADIGADVVTGLSGELARKAGLAERQLVTGEYRARQADIPLPQLSLERLPGTDRVRCTGRVTVGQDGFVERELAEVVLRSGDFRGSDSLVPEDDTGATVWYPIDMELPAAALGDTLRVEVRAYPEIWRTFTYPTEALWSATSGGAPVG